MSATPASRRFSARQLGPVFDNESCEGCHFADGRGRPPMDGRGLRVDAVSCKRRRGDAVRTAKQSARRGGAGAGAGLRQPAADAGGRRIDARDHRFGDLRRLRRHIRGRHSVHAPVTAYTLLGVYAALPAPMMFSPRVAPVVFGLGLLEAIPAAPIESNADPATAIAMASRVGRTTWKIWSAAAAGDRPVRLEGEHAEPGAAGGRRLQRRHGHHVDVVSRRIMRRVPRGMRGPPHRGIRLHRRGGGVLHPVTGCPGPSRSR